MESGLPQDIRNFLTDCIETVSQLELLFIFYENKTRTWTATSISKELRTHASMALKQMDVLQSKGILKKENDQFSYAPQSEKIDENISKLHELYRERPVAIVTFIYTKPEDKLKGFADAFKFKKE